MGSILNAIISKPVVIAAVILAIFLLGGANFLFSNPAVIIFGAVIMVIFMMGKKK